MCANEQRLRYGTNERGAIRFFVGNLNNCKKYFSIPLSKRACTMAIEEKKCRIQTNMTGQGGGIDFDVGSYYSRPHTYVVVFKRRRRPKRAGDLPPYVHRLWNPTACYRPRALGYQRIDTDNDEFGQQISFTTKKTPSKATYLPTNTCFVTSDSFSTRPTLIRRTCTAERTGRFSFRRVIEDAIRRTVAR